MYNKLTSVLNGIFLSQFLARYELMRSKTVLQSINWGFKCNSSILLIILVMQSTFLNYLDKNRTFLSKTVQKRKFNCSKVGVLCIFQYCNVQLKVGTFVQWVLTLNGARWDDIRTVMNDLHHHYHCYQPELNSDLFNDLKIQINSSFCLGSPIRQDWT